MSNNAIAGLTSVAGIYKIKFGDMVRMIVGSSVADNVIFSESQTAHDILAYAKGNMTIAQEMSAGIYESGAMPVAWMLSVAASDYTVKGTVSPHIVAGGHFDKPRVDINSIEEKYGKYMLSNGSEPITLMHRDTDADNITCILSASKILESVADIIAETRGIANPKYMVSVLLNKTDMKNSVVYMTVGESEVFDILNLK